MKAGGRVVTQTLPGGRYVHICYDSAGKGHLGEVKQKKRGLDDGERDSNDLRTFDITRIQAR